MIRQTRFACDPIVRSARRLLTAAAVCAAVLTAQTAQNISSIVVTPSGTVSGAHTVAILKNGASAGTCTIANGSGSSCTIAGPISFAASDTVEMRVVRAGTSGTSRSFTVAANYAETADSTTAPTAISTPHITMGRVTFGNVSDRGRGGSVRGGRLHVGHELQLHGHRGIDGGESLRCDLYIGRCVHDYRQQQYHGHRVVHVYG